MWKTHHESRFPNGKPWVSTSLLVYPQENPNEWRDSKQLLDDLDGTSIHGHGNHRLEPFGTMKPQKNWVKVRANILLT